MVETINDIDVINVVVKWWKLHGTVEKYRYLGSWITSNDDAKKTRIGMT